MVLKICKIGVSFILIISLFISSVSAETESLAIISPLPTHKLPSAYLQIIEGINTKTPTFKKNLLYFTDKNVLQVKSWLKNNKPSRIVIIGNKATDMLQSSSLNNIFRVASLLKKNTHYYQPGISLSMSIKEIKKKIHLYLPKIKNIYIADSGKNILWFLDDNTSSYPKINITKIENKEESIVRYLAKKIDTINPYTDILWIDNSLDPIILYKLSEMAWEKNIILISNDIKNLESGVALVFYPDFKGMGERMGEILSSQLNHLLEPLRSINVGINLRTARHLGITISPEIKNNFKIIIK